MEIAINNIQEKVAVSPELTNIITTVLEKAAEIYGVGEKEEVSVVLSDDKYIRSLNSQYRGKDVSTDVLSFALNEGDEPVIVGGSDETLLGDIVISMETTVRQAEEYGHSLERELAFLALHGMLHLIGYDHETDEQREEMRREEEHVLSLAGLARN